MANILWNQLDKEKQEKYIKRLTALGVLSGLFKELDGKMVENHIFIIETTKSHL